MRRAAEEDENTARIARARSEEENESSIRQGRMKSMEREQAIKRVTPELDVAPVGKVAKLAKTAAGAAATGLRNRARDVETAAAKAFSRPQAREVGRYTSPAETRRRAADQRKKQAEARNEEMRFADEGNPNFKKGGKVNRASSRADGIAKRGKTRGRVL